MGYGDWFFNICIVYIAEMFITNGYIYKQDVTYGYKGNMMHKYIISQITGVRRRTDFP